MLPPAHFLLSIGRHRPTKTGVSGAVKATISKKGSAIKVERTETIKSSKEAT